MFVRVCIGLPIDGKTEIAAVVAVSEYNWMKEDSYIEFKSSFTDAVVESLVAFANTEGGSVYVGVEK